MVWVVVMAVLYMVALVVIVIMIVNGVGCTSIRLVVVIVVVRSQRRRCQFAGHKRGTVLCNIITKHGIDNGFIKTIFVQNVPHGDQIIGSRHA